MIQRIVNLIRGQRHVNWAVLDQGVISGVNFLTGILLARYLGIVEYGIFALAWLAVEFLHSIQQSLIVAPLMSIGPKYADEEKPGYFGAVILQQLIFAVFCFVFVVVAMMGFATYSPNWEFGPLTVPLAIAIVTCQIQNFARRYLFTVNKPAAAFFVDVTRYGLQTVLLLWLLLTVDMDVGLTLWVISGTAALASVLGLFFLGTVVFSAKPFRDALARHWHFSKWLVSSEIMRWATGNLFVVAAGAMLGPAAVGTIRAAQNLVGVCHILILGLENVIPIVASRRFSQHGIQSLVNYIKKVAVVGAVTVGAIVLIMAVAPEFWLGLVYGSEYLGNGYLVRWWAVIYFVEFLGIMPRFGLRTMEQTQPMFIAFFATAVFSVVSIYPLISMFGVIGVMIGNLCVTSIRGAMMSFSFIRLVRQQKILA